MREPARSPCRLRSILARAGLSLGLAPLGGCFEETDPIVDDDDDLMCVQAPCTDTEVATGSPPPGTTAATGDDPGTTTAPGETSADETTAADPVCGDGELNQPSEMCDSTPGCLDDCTFEDYACNPLNDANCVEGLRCGAVEVTVESFACMPPGRGGLGAACSGLPSNDSDCDAGLTCLFNLNTPLCDLGNCCVEYCDLVAPDPGCSPGTVCNQFFLAPMGQGLEHLGYCGNP